MPWAFFSRGICTLEIRAGFGETPIAPARSLAYPAMNCIDVAPRFSRRAFIQTSAAGAVACLSPHVFGASGVASGRKLRLGIVGGRFGLTFQFHEHPECAVVAVSDLRPERRAALQKTYRCDQAYDSLEVLLKDPKVEAVFLATPMPDHPRHVLQCLAAGKHVLCAVPAAMTLDECQQLIAAVKKTGLTYMMAETSHWQQLTISARKFYREGAFGRLYYTESEYHHPGLEELYFENGRRTWRHGMAPMQYPTHCTSHLGRRPPDRAGQCVPEPILERDRALQDGSGQRNARGGLVARRAAGRGTGALLRRKNELLFQWSQRRRALPRALAAQGVNRKRHRGIRADGATDRALHGSEVVENGLVARTFAAQ